jgi:small-conductance mechanosensitive channel
MEDFLNQVYYGNTIQNYITALIIFLAGVLIITIFKRIILKRLKRWAESTETKLDDFVIKGVEKTLIPLLYFGILFFAIKLLVIPDKVERVINIISVVIVTFLVIKTVVAVIRFSLNAYMMRREQGETKQKQIRGLITIVNITVWIIGILFLLDNLGFEISAVIAGLGIGGIAIALAAQAVLGDLFSYFVIFFDRPFEIGDFVIVGDKMGNIENIGIKTTRIRSLSGEQLVCSNTDLTNSRVHNYKRMERRRIVFKLGVLYETKVEHLEEIPKIIKQIIDDQEKATFDRSHFIAYGDFSLNFETVYFVDAPDYVIYADTQQSINLKIYKEFSKRGIVFAYPTQTLYLQKQNSSDGPKTEIVPAV